MMQRDSTLNSPQGQSGRPSQAPHPEDVEDYFAEEFELPVEEFNDGRLSHYQLTQQAKSRRRINVAKASLKRETSVGEDLDAASESMIKRVEEDTMSKMLSFGKSINLGAKRSLIGARMHNVRGEAKKELDFVKSVVGKDHGRLQELSRMTVEDFEEESTIEFPKLHTVEEKLEDLRQEGYETWWRRRGREIAARFSNKDKRMLRKWFQELDYDGSGEVSVVELQDPMLSAGIFKTREQIFRVMLNADKNDTMGLDFEEFLNALYNSKNKLIDTNKLKKLQAMGNDPNGIEMETLITEERRKKIINSILNQMEKREKEFHSTHDKYIRSGRKLEKEKKRQKEEDARAQQLVSSQSKSSHPLTGSGTGRGRSSTAGTSTGDGTKLLSAVQRRAANKNNPIFKEHLRASTNFKLMELKHGDDKKLHDQYLRSLDVVLKQKRDQEDRRMDQKMAVVREGMHDSIDYSSGPGPGGGTNRMQMGGQKRMHDPLIMKRHNAFHSYKRSADKPSMFGQHSRRAYQLSVEQADGKTHLNVLD